jgi:GTP-binding protein HflX
VDRDASGTPTAVWLSARTSAGIPLLLTALSERLADDLVRQSYHLTPAHGRLRALLYKAGAIIAESLAEDGGTIVDLCIPAAKLQRLLRSEGLPENPNASPPTQTGAGLHPEKSLCAHGDPTSWS